MVAQRMIGEDWVLRVLVNVNPQELRTKAFLKRLKYCLICFHFFSVSRNIKKLPTISNHSRIVNLTSA